MADIKKYYKDVPLSGRYMTCDPVFIGTNFQTLKNMRYTDHSIRSILGMTKINTTALSTYLKTRSAFHYKKPTESHLLVQAYNTGLTASKVYENTTAIPSAGAFSSTAVWDDTSTGIGSFSDAPNGQMAYCNGQDVCIWAGDEDEVASFINYADDNSFWYDYTDKVNNTQSDSTNIATLTNSSLATAKALYHFDDALTDSSGNSHTLTGTGTPTYSTGLFSKCVTLNGTTQYLSIASHADFNFSAGSFTFDGKFRVHSIAAVRPILYWATVVKSIAFNTGTTQPTVGQTLYGETSGAVIKVLNVPTLGGGAWDGSGTGTFYYQITSGTIQSGEHIHAEAAGAGSLICNTTGAPGAAGNNYVKLSIDTAGKVQFVVYESYASPGNVVSMSSSTAVVVNSWYHIEISESDNNWYMFLGKSGATASLQTTTSDANRLLLYTGTLYLGYDTSTYFDGDMEEVRFCQSCIHTSAFPVPTSAYGSSEPTYVLVASRRAASGFKFYLGTANTGACTVSVYEWNGTSYAALSPTDGTDDSGVSMAQDGSVTWSSTVSTSKPRMVKEILAYYYLFKWEGLDAATTVYKCTAIMPFQPIKDMWDGVYRGIDKCLVYQDTYVDNTANIYAIDYDADATLSYLDLGDLDTDEYVFFQCAERLQGFYFLIPDNEKVNSTANSIMSIDYWNGYTWTSVGDIEDGTSTSAISMSQMGTVTWQQLEENIEFKKAINGNVAYYSYRVSFSQKLSSDVRIDYVGGVTAAKPIGQYKFPIFAQGRLLLCGDMGGDKYKLICSSKDMPDVFNGSDSLTVYLGDSGELNCGTELYSLFGNSLYSLVFLFKDTETWVIAGTDINEWENNMYMISPTIGCPAPKSLATINLSAEPGAGTNRALVIWQGAHGIYMSDGRAPIPIHGDIKAYFDPTDSKCITSSKVGDSVGFVDPVNQEYHLLMASGTSATTLNTELVYDVVRNKWFVIDRSSDLQYGVLVHDTDGNAYTYGFLDTGYMERLEYGKDFDGTKITSNFRFGDNAPMGNFGSETMLDCISLITKSKNTTSETIAVTHYADGNTTGTTLKDCFDVGDSTSRLAFPFLTDNIGGFTFHSLDFSYSDNTEDIGFEPISVGIKYHEMRTE